MARILFVLTGADHWTLADGTKHPTGFWAEELLAPYRVFVEDGHEIAVATPGGVRPVVDEASLAPGANGGEEGAARARREVAEIPQLESPLVLADIDTAAYDAVFYPGGHGPMEDLASDADSARVITETLAADKPVALVCHGPAALVATSDAPGGPPFAGRRLTAFTNAEETQGGLAAKAPWLLQDRLRELGADFVEAEPWGPHVVVDGRLLTGQNPASSLPLAQELSAALR
ncbi:type 1 glutamine amidotransferase domain-containing protein [Streptomonospora nanhaiensis]|uniref:type 1 glutamine amidotransferase domain-containing protein n=1 Tax=Streptomonospora nanhaiensis TaxID=1323731 RepID=UPI001C3806CD|nr:type 1 glutamine amidotransferase domain-containing protein [Streptomonospora nanhaiensis]MBV2366489.1 type 1 glutamine amidotransferase domain-containing protein [Streptomonospora nanhaiensis]MBX9390008.1 type 1 glutamine amidotransferase domain-containing protein [Streptomonospora nanhaiensis]